MTLYAAVCFKTGPPIRSPAAVPKRLRATADDKFRRPRFMPGSAPSGRRCGPFGVVTCGAEDVGEATAIGAGNCRPKRSLKDVPEWSIGEPALAIGRATPSSALAAAAC